MTTPTNNGAGREPGDSDARITEAFRDLQRRAAFVPVDAGPHRVGAPGADGGRGHDRWLIPAVAFAVLAVVAGFSAWRLWPSDVVETNTVDIADDGRDSETGEPDRQSDATGDVETETIVSVTGAPEQVYVLTETGIGTEGRFASVLNTDTLLPADAVDAVFDGVGGAFYITDTEVWHQSPSGERRRLAAAEYQARLVAARTVNDRPTVLVLVDQTLVGYRADGSSVELGLDRFDGPVRRIGILGSTVAAILGDAESPTEVDSNVRIEVWSLDDDEIETMVEPTAVDADEAPRDLALTDTGLVVLTDTELRVLSADAEVDSFPLPVPYDDAVGLGGDGMTVDAAGDRVVLAFGEAAMTIDLATGRREVVPGVEAWVRAAHWADAAPPEQSVRADGVEVTAGDRLRVDTEAVRSDTDDPFLNVRGGAGADGELVAKLQPTYRGLRATGERETADDGADWIEVELLHPVAYGGPDPGGDNPTGWINAAYAIVLADTIGVGLDEVPGCVLSGSGDSATGTLTGTAYVYGLESRFLSDDCLRVVLTVAPGSSSYVWTEVPAGTGPASALPEVQVTSSGGGGVVVDLGDVASAWPATTETEDDLYVARGDDGTLDLVSPLPVRSVVTTPLADIGVVVIDLEVTGSAPIADRFVALTGEPTVGTGSVAVNGLARPFEAILGVSIVDEGDRPVEAVYSGNPAFGTIQASDYGAQTTDWTEAWGRFSVRADGLAPGDYVMLLDGEGGVEDPTPTRVPFTITEGPADDIDAGLPSSREQAVAQAAVQFARGGEPGSVPLADQVTLGLGTAITRTLSAEELGDRGAWVIDEEVFAGYSGPFDLLGPVADGRVRYSRGPIDHCAGPPLTWPEEWGSLTQLNIEPIDADSCLQWYGLSLFLNDSGNVEVVVLDVWEP